MSGNATSSVAGDSQVLESKLLMRRVTRMTNNSFKKNPISFLTTGVKSVIESSESAQSSPEGAIIISKDLKQTHGDTVKIDMLHKLKGLAVMGERNIEGKEEGISRSQFSLRIEQVRKPVFGGSRKAQQMRGYPLKKAARMALDEWWRDYYNELCFAHLAGARGKYYEDDLILPPTEPTFLADGLPADDELSENYVNPLMPATYDRHFYAGAADSIDGSNPLTPTDTMDIETCKRVGVALQTMAYPLGAISLEKDDKPMNTDPIYLGLMTPEQFKDVEDSAPDFAQLQANARERVSGFNHELFKNDCFMIENVLWRKYFTPVRWYAGDIMNISRNDKGATVTTSQVPGNLVNQQVDRAMIIGNQALALALAGDTNGTVFKTDEEEFDLNDKHRTALRWMGGMKKTRQFTRSGRAYDPGVLVIDSVSNPVTDRN